MEEYYKMESANVKESEEQTMVNFLNGLNHPIKRIADFQPYNTLVELVHQATKVERQVQEDARYSNKSSYVPRSNKYTPRSASNVKNFTRAIPSNGGPSSSKVASSTIQPLSSYTKTQPTQVSVLQSPSPANLVT